MEYDKLDLIQQKAKNLLNDLKDDKDSSGILSALYILVVAYVITLSVLYIFNTESDWIKFVILLFVLVALLLLYRIRMSGAYRDSNMLSGYTNIDPAQKSEYTSGLLKYLSSGYAVKLNRIKTVRIIYMILFPIFLVLVREVWLEFSSKEDYSSGLGQYLGAFLLAAPFWYMFFREDIVEKEMDHEDVNAMIRKIQS